jgi:lipopolysaccharide transport system ATP-binding protein
MSDIAIRVQSLSKQYRIGTRQQGYKTFRETLVDLASAPLRRLIGRRPDETNSFWALKDVSFDIKRGEVVGIVGRNGAGKSTLLKILSEITYPTTGSIDIYGRVGSLLEVGTGFHAELTGRENIYLNGAILGMRRTEIQRKFDEIVDFAEVEKFIDTPVKHYSSGMRLAFAVAAHLETEILIVDEVLAVGDLEFQKKCLGKMSDVAASGKTVLFVSHNMSAVKRLCTLGILLSNGTVVELGDVESIIQAYVSRFLPVEQTEVINPPADPDTSGYLSGIAFEDSAGSPVSSVAVGEPWRIRATVCIVKPTEHFMMAVGIRSDEEINLRTTWSLPTSLLPGTYNIFFYENDIWLSSGRYILSFGLSSFERTFHYIEKAATFEILPYTNRSDFVRVAGVGYILNPMRTEIVKVD